MSGMTAEAIPDRGPARPIAILAALRQETRSILSLLGRARILRAGAVKYHRGEMAQREVLILKTGVGLESASRSTGALLEVERPGIIIATGFCGGLRPGLSAGDLLVPSEICRVEAPARASGGAPAAIGASSRPDPGLLSVALGLGGVAGPAGKTRIVTVERVQGSAREKRALGENLEADGVDMESSAVAEAADRAGIPFLCVRAVLDDCDLDLPFDLGGILSPSGRPRPLAALKEIAMHPRSLWKLSDLAARARRAERSLGAFLERLIERLPR